MGPAADMRNLKWRWGLRSLTGTRKPGQWVSAFHAGHHQVTRHQCRDLEHICGPGAHLGTGTSCIQESPGAHHQTELSCICSFGEGSEEAAVLEATLVTSPFPKHLQQREMSRMGDLVLSSVAGFRATSSSLYVKCCLSPVASRTWMPACCRSRVQSA